MMNRLRGRNLAHPGCLIGITAGLTIGIILAAVLAIVNVPLTIDLFVWLALVVGLGSIGWIAGTLLTSRFPIMEENRVGTDPNSPVN
jgi:hypothetical protein